MAAETNTEAFVACCLHLAHGDSSITIGDLLGGIETWQDREDRHLGISRSDTRGAMRELARLLGHDAWNSSRFEALLDAVTLAAWLPEMLKHRAVYFNDEGESWIADPGWADGAPGSPDWRDPMGHRARQRRRTILRMIAEPAPRPPSETLSILRNLGLGSTILISASRPGESS